MKFTGPCAQSVLDLVMILCPLSQGDSGLVDRIAPVKDNAFLGTSADESVLLAGYLPATCRLLAGYLLDCRCVSRLKK